MALELHKVAFITGASSGIGLETARLFASRGWNVVATMRHPEKSGREFAGMGNVALARLDVLDSKSIGMAVALAKRKYGRIDVLVNNAGYGLVGPVEGASRADFDAQVGTNLVGLMDVTRQALPLMRRQGGGVIVNLSSMAGAIPFPLYSMYNATKFGVEGFSESLAYELNQFNVKVRLVEPGMIDTDFYSRSMAVRSHPAYAKYGKKALSGMHGGHGRIPPSRVAQEIYRAATDSGDRMRYPVGGDAKLLLMLRRVLPWRAYKWFFRRLVGF